MVRTAHAGEDVSDCVHARIAFTKTARLLTLPATAPAGVAAWYLSRPSEISASVCAPYLTRDDWREFAALRCPLQRRRAFAMRAFLRHLLSEATDGSIAPRDWRFERTSFGKLRLTEGFPEIDFSISHGHAGSCIAVCRGGRIGIDIADTIVPDWQNIADELFNWQERNILNAAAPCRRERTFLRLWTAKEAFGKLLGVGLAMDAPANDCDVGTYLAFSNLEIGSSELFVSLAVDAPAVALAGSDPAKKIA